VCKKVLTRTLDTVDRADYKKPELVEEALLNYCKTTTKESKEKKLVSHCHCLTPAVAPPPTPRSATTSPL
jgi:hypothetical protein